MRERLKKVNRQFSRFPLFFLLRRGPQSAIVWGGGKHFVQAVKYKRILLKLSGEVLGNRAAGDSIDPAVVADIARRIARLARQGVEIGVVLGGGNIFRGAQGETAGTRRVTGDYMGMLATIINGLALQDAVEAAGVQTRLQSSIDMPRVAESFIQRRALRHLEKGRVVIFAGGTGNPYFSTDTAAALRASEIKAEVLLKATKVDGIYTADPMKDPAAKRYDTLTYADALRLRLKVMDATAFALCMDNHLPVIVFDFFDENALDAAVRGEKIGTLVSD